MLFPEKISTHYASKFKASNSCDCPLSKQVKFSAKENIVKAHFKNDPLCEHEAEIEPGILQKYAGRLLVLASNQCAIHCRFCFRRNTIHKKIDNLPKKLSRILKRDKTIKEVILSGGDPLMLKDSELKAFLNAIPKHARIRIHSRVPIAIPSRFTPALFRLLSQLGSRLILVVHVNHPNELDKDSEKIFKQLSMHGATLLSQSVLLKGINDNRETLATLSEKLFSQRVLPYYLHNLDKAQGASHFEVPLRKAKTVFCELKNMLPGYLVPKLVQEIAGDKSKRIVC